MDKKFIESLYQAHQACPNCPSPQQIANSFTHLLSVLFPDFSHEDYKSLADFELEIQNIRVGWKEMVNNTAGNRKLDAEQVIDQFFENIPEIHKQLTDDVDAMYQGDPAAKNVTEVIRTYPGFLAIAAYRLAHKLYRLGVAGIPRIITEHAHSKTGIDIHPGAKIGKHFCIDHGTGIVIGETTVIGNHVKLYQGVTLGALSVEKSDAEKKRHPTIEDHVVIYAGATILGGDTVIGHNSTIGGNVWLTRSVPAYSKIYYQSKMNSSEKEEIDRLVITSDKRNKH